METGKQNAIRTAYNNAASRYGELFFRELYGKPIDRKLYDLFFEKTVNRGKVLEIGCGPGEIADYLKMKGSDIVGIDISEKMIEIARSLNPDIEFRVGDVFGLDYPDASVAGIVAPYLIVNFGAEDLPDAFREMYRVVVPGGTLLFSFHTGNETKTFPDFIVENNPLEYTFFDPDRVLEVLISAGWIADEQIFRSPYDGEVTHRAYIFAHKKPI